MKYVYSFKLKKLESYNFVVIEYINEHQNLMWALQDLLDYPTSLEENVLAFPMLRAKHWLKENHPELII